MTVHEVAPWFLGPKAENADFERTMLARILEDYFDRRRTYFPNDPPAAPCPGVIHEFQSRLAAEIDTMLAALRSDFPFHSPRYIGHMVSDQTLPSVLGYFAGLLHNPNNVTGETSPATLNWELEVGADILRMLGFTPPPADGRTIRAEFGWAHLTSGGTVANLEALWLARNIRYFPLAAKDVCERHGIAIHPVDSMSLEACLGISPAESIDLYANLISVVRRHWHLAHTEAIRVAHELLRSSIYNIAHRGTGAAYDIRPPALLVSGARHYSITKAADLLGIGRENIVMVDVDHRFRMDVRDLRAKLQQLTESGSLPVAVIGIAGTTEEGAVDPIDRIALLRDENQLRLGESFWLHVDAAWGGYVRTLFNPPAAIAAIRDFVSNGRESWGSDDVCSAIEAFPCADSITVDPHKLGYVPYPCGVAAYKNDLVRQFITEEIPYISDLHFEDTDPREHRAPRSVGPYILEGSKPGSAAAACWLAHRTIPLDRSGHGKIIKASLLAARELYDRLAACDHAANDRDLPYRILPIADQPPDTNVVCFLIQEAPAQSLARTNALNRWIHHRFTLDPARPAPPPFFLSRTIFEPSSYSSAGIRALLDRAAIDPGDYRLHGLFILRATVMNPFCEPSLLAEFIPRLHEQILAGLATLR